MVQNKCLRLKVILWKNCMIRKHHWFLTLLEIAVPVTLFTLLTWVRAQFGEFDRTYIATPTYVPRYTSELVYRSFNETIDIYYAPKTEFTTKLIRKVQTKLEVDKAKVKGMKSEADFLVHYETMEQEKPISAVIFNNVYGKELPKEFNYVIRTVNREMEWDTEPLFGLVQKLIYMPGTGSLEYFTTGFLALQMALDTSFIEMATKQNFPVMLSVQEFPYPPYTKDGGIKNVFGLLLPHATIISFLLLFPAVLKRVVEEKVSGIKELMKMMGLQSWMLWLGWLCHALMVNLISIIIIAVLMKVKLFGADYPTIEHCNASVFGVFLLLYCVSAITFCFMVSSFFNKPTVATIIGFIAWFLPGFLFYDEPKWRLSIKMFLSILLPNVALSYGYREIASYESREVGSDWSNLFKSASGDGGDITLGLVFIAFLLSSILFMLITLYFENIKPGPYGLAKPFHFPVLYVWKKISKDSNKTEVNKEESISNSYGKIEPTPDLKVGIQTKNLFKQYGRNMAVNNFSIDIYEGQITALLGHNGAGKTTTMSIITGMISANSGKVYVDGKDIKYSMKQVRRSLGFCPQHNLQFRDLNVIEHLMFFGMLKGLSRKEAEVDATDFLKKMNLYQKRHYRASSLSGGMRRKLSLGIALVGNSKVLILDEPTSGLDPEARREIWDILLTFRGSRTILITTHFMEEADVLGDRIAIMDHGRLICYGSSMFLKKEYGTGYNLTLIRDEESYQAFRYWDSDQVVAITTVVQGIISDANLLSTSGKHVSFLLPHNKKKLFGSLLGTLESRKEELCITNIALSVTTLEEVFLRVGDQLMQDDKKGTSTAENSVYGTDNIVYSTNSSTKLMGVKLLKMQLWSLWNKRWCVLRRKWLFFVVSLIVTVLVTFLVLCLSEASSNPAANLSKFEIDLSAYGTTTVFYGGAASGRMLTKMERQYELLIKSKKSKPYKVDSVSIAIISEGKKNIAYFKQFMIVAAEFDISSNRTEMTNAMYSNAASHGAAISLNLLMNTVLKSSLGNAYSISATNAPLPKLHGYTLLDISKEHMVYLWVLPFPITILFLTGTFLMFPHMERASKVKQLQLMCGVRPVYYWLVCYVFDLILYVLAIFVILIFIMLYGFIGSKTFSGEKELVALLVIFIAYGLPVIPYVYLYSYRKTAGGAFAFYIMGTAFLSMVVVVIYYVMVRQHPHSLMALNCIFLFPQNGLIVLLGVFADKAAWNHNWNIKSPEHRMLTCEKSEFYNPCCEGENTTKCLDYRSYFKNKKEGAYPIEVMIASTLLYIAILLLVESNFLHKCWETILVFIFRPKKRNLVSHAGDKEDVEVESKRISDVLKQEKAINLRNMGDGSSNQRTDEDDLLLVHQLQKIFSLHYAVRSVSFAVKPGECFGLLGVNGAGKTTTFRILTGDVPLITGQARILTPNKERIYLSKHFKKYLKQVGYCPQFDALNEVLTGREMLRVFAALRGISNGAEEEIKMWLAVLGLEEYADKPCGQYSGGNKRKLSVAIALIGGLPLVMLDEPTSGVDPVSRRKLWDTLSALQKQEIKPSIVLTSHSMEECEALCNKLAIMKAGQLECYGTIPNIKQKYAQGFTVLLKLKQSSSATPTKAEDKVKLVTDQKELIHKPSASKTGGQTSRKKSKQESDVVEDSEAVKVLMNAFENKYKGFCTLKDKHAGLLHYHINDKLKKWNQIFNEIEEFKTKHSIIEDYNISETTLEEVFLSIARANVKNK